MKSAVLLLSTILLTTFLSCKNNQQTAGNSDVQDTTAQSSPFLPVGAILNNDKKLADTFATAFLKRVETGSHKDSAFINPAEFNRLSMAFFPSVLMDSAAFRQHYNESSIMDETTGLLNFIYTAKDVSDSLHQVVVYISPTQTTDQTNRVYMEHAFKQGDTLVQQKLTWKLKQYFYILTIRQPATGDAVITNEKVIWNPEKFRED